VILRAGFDVPLKEGRGGKGEGEELIVADDTRIKDVLSTLKYLIGQKAKIIVMSHLGRPEGWDKSKSLRPVAEKLAQLLNFKFVEIVDRIPSYSVPHLYFFAQDITKQDHSGWSKKISAGNILFLENLRFYPGEQQNDEEFVEVLARFGDVYVNEAFSVAHRKDASTFGLARKLPAYGGVNFIKEIRSLQKIISNPAQPFVFMVGGAKIDDKIETIHNLAQHASQIIVGGAVANAFLAAHGYEIGGSKVSDVPLARQLLRSYKTKIVLPVDLVTAPNPAGTASLVKVDGVKKAEQILDIGPESVRKFSGLIKQAQTLVWNGPFGLFENPKFAFGSKSLAQVFASRSKGKAFGVIGGGETVEVFDLAKVSQFVDHVSTGGGAMLEFLAGKELPAIKALEGK